MGIFFPPILSAAFCRQPLDLLHVMHPGYLGRIRSAWKVLLRECQPSQAMAEQWEVSQSFRIFMHLQQLQCSRCISVQLIFLCFKGTSSPSCFYHCHAKQQWLIPPLPSHSEMCPQTRVAEPGSQGQASSVGKSLGSMEGKTSTRNKMWAQGVFKEPFPKAIYSSAEPFLLPAGTWNLIWQFPGHL